MTLMGDGRYIFATAGPADADDDDVPHSLSMATPRKVLLLPVHAAASSYSHYSLLRRARHHDATAISSARHRHFTEWQSAFASHVAGRQYRYPRKMASYAAVAPSLMKAYPGQFLANTRCHAR